MSEKENRSIFLRSVYEASIEILGRSDSILIFSTIINWDGSGEIPDIDNEPKFLSDLGNDFAIRYQRNTAKGLMLRLGDSSFTLLRRRQKKLHELGSIENRLKTISKRFDFSLGVLSENLSVLTGLNISTIQKSENSYCLEIAGYENDELFSSDMHLFFFAGLLRAFCAWLDSRKEYFIDVLEQGQSDNGGNSVCLRYEDLTP
jgi:hypothetical protein